MKFQCTLTDSICNSLTHSLSFVYAAIQALQTVKLAMSKVCICTSPL